MEVLIVIISIIVILILGFLILPLLMGRTFLPGLTLKLVKSFGFFINKITPAIKPDLDLELLVKAFNRYYHKRFAATPFAGRYLFLPFCLRPKDCPALIDPVAGLLCDSACTDCSLGAVRQEALDMGYGQVFIVPSSRLMKSQDFIPSSSFIKEKITQGSPGAALGIICTWHLRNRLLPSHKDVGRRGYMTNNNKQGTALQGVLLDSKNCKLAKVRWDKVRQYMQKIQL